MVYKIAAPFYMSIESSAQTGQTAANHSSISTTL